MNKERYKLYQGKQLRYGYTTGSCAAASASAAAAMLLGGESISEVRITLPRGETAMFEVKEPGRSGHSARCYITKDGGDDPDVTSGLHICAEVSAEEPGKEDREQKEPDIIIDGGEGVGRVTQEGLQCSVGEAAINPVPRRMIAENVRAVAKRYGFRGRLNVVISVPGGEETAQKTFNPRLGIVGGISILGTTGIVEPMSEKALIDTIKVEIDKRYAEDPETILIMPGNYGSDFCREELGLDLSHSAEISNYVGEALDYIKYKGFREVLFVGHTGKLIKTAAGVMNTHSSYADARMEVIGVHAACCGAPADKVEKILHCLTTDEALSLIHEEPYFEDVKQRILERAMYHLKFRLRGDRKIRVEVVMFTTKRDNIIASPGAWELIEKVRKR